MLLTVLSMMQAKSSRFRLEDPAMEERGSCDNDRESLLLACVLLVLVNSGHLGVQQVGRLAQVSKELNQVTTLDDHIWASFCQRHWMGTRHIPRRCLDANGGHRSLYRQWCTPLVRRQTPNRLSRLYQQCCDLFPKKEQQPLGPPTCSADEIQLHVLVKYKGVTIVSHVIEGEGIERFCRDGTTVLQLARPFKLGLAYWEVSREGILAYLDDVDEGQNADGLEVGSRPKFEPASLNVKVYCYRTTDSTMACVLCSEECRQQYFPLRLHPLRNLHVDSSKPEEMGVMGIGAYRVENFRGLPLRETKEAWGLRRKFPDPIDFTAYAVFKMDRRLDFVMTKIFLDIMKEPKPGDVMVRRFNALETKEHGVSLLHILSELRGV